MSHHPFAVDTDGVVSYIPHVMISFEVLGNPRTWRRPTLGSNGHLYNPSRNDEEEFKETVKKIIGPGKYSPLFQSGDSLSVTLKFFMSHALRNSDVDNLIKFVFDSLKGVVYDDDRDIILVTARKALDASSPRTCICVEKI